MKKELIFKSKIGINNQQRVTHKGWDCKTTQNLKNIAI